MPEKSLPLGSSAYERVPERFFWKETFRLMPMTLSISLGNHTDQTNMPENKRFGMELYNDVIASLRAFLETFMDIDDSMLNIVTSTSFSFANTQLLTVQVC